MLPVKARKKFNTQSVYYNLIEIFRKSLWYSIINSISDDMLSKRNDKIGYQYFATD